MNKILIIIPYGGVGGIERLALNFYHYYKAVKYDVKVVKIVQQENDIVRFGDDELYLSRQDFSTMSKGKRLRFYTSGPMQIRKIVHRYKITHSIALGDMANLFSSLSFSKEYKVGSIHSMKSLEFSNPSFFNKVSKFGYRSSYRFLDKVVCISKAIKEDLLQNCGFAFPKKLEVIYNPHDIKNIKKLAEEHIEEPIEKNLFKTPIVLFLGRISTVKAPWYLLKAFSLAVQKAPNLRLVFLGDGDTEVLNTLKTMIATRGLEEKVVFLGRKANPYPYLAKARVLALSSYYEGTPNVIVEAMSLSVPIVTTKCTDGIEELMGTGHPLNGVTDTLYTEVGIITPSVFKGTLEIPKDTISLSAEEISLAQGLQEVVNGRKFYRNLDELQKLLQKFDLETVANSYLKPRDV